MRNIINKIRKYYFVSDEAIAIITSCFKEHTFPAKTIIIQAEKLDRQVFFIEKGITRSYVLNNDLVFYGR